MRVIIVEDTVYKITEKEYKILDEMRDKVNEAEWPLSDVLDEELNEYLDRNVNKYHYVGPVQFDWRR